MLLLGIALKKALRPRLQGPPRFLAHDSRFCDHSKDSKIKHQEDSKTSVYFCNFWGCKFSWESFWAMKHLEWSRVCPPTVQTQKWSAQERLRGRGHFLHPLPHLRHQDLRSRWWEKHPGSQLHPMLQLLHNVLGWSKGDGMETKSAMTKKPGDLISFLKPQWMHIRLRSSRCGTLTFKITR